MTQRYTDYGIVVIADASDIFWWNENQDHHHCQFHQLTSYHIVTIDFIHKRLIWKSVNWWLQTVLCTTLNCVTTQLTVNSSELFIMCVDPCFALSLCTHSNAVSWYSRWSSTLNNNQKDQRKGRKKTKREQQQHRQQQGQWNKIRDAPSKRKSKKDIQCFSIIET